MSPTYIVIITAAVTSPPSKLCTIIYSSAC
jgi:hypothetical protein